jgi:hypothetical protein
MEQIEITDRIKFGNNHMPPFPILRNFCSASPVVESMQFESLRQFNIRDKDIMKNLKKMIKPLVSDGYDIEYFFVKQRIFKEIQTASVSHHAWFYYQMSNKGLDMTDVDLEGTIVSGGVSVNDYIAIPTKSSFGGHRINNLTLNGLGKRTVCLQDQAQSPSNENAFRILQDNNYMLKLISVAYIEKIKKAIVTLHVLQLY